MLDIIGFKVESGSNAREHGGPKRRVWRKVQLGNDEQTWEIRVAVITSDDIGDAPKMLTQSLPDQ